MIDFVAYVVSELASKRLSKTDALALITQFQQRTKGAAPGAWLHPLLHRNSSDLNQQSYTTDFSGEESFLRDHQVDGKKVLPGVVYLEMARAAVEAASPGRDESEAIEIRNLVWAHPIIVAEPKEVVTALVAGDSQIDFEVYSREADEEVVHSRGLAVFVSKTMAPAIDVAQLQARMTRGVLEAANIYAAYEKMGMRYGPAQKAVVSIQQGEQQVLARLSLPVMADHSIDDYRLHPSLMDAALQSALGLLGDLGKLPDRPTLPFALESLRVFGACSREMFAWLRYSPGSKAGDAIIKLDIDLCDLEGTICAQMRGFTSRVLKASGVLYAEPYWEEAEATATADSSPRHVLLVGLPNVSPADVEAASCLCLEGDYTEAAVATFERIRKIFEEKPQGRVIVQVVGSEESSVLGLSGLLKTASSENPRLVGQVILTDSQISARELAAQLRGPLHPAVKYEFGIRHALKWRELAVEGAEPASAFKDHGAYLITGGLGGLGVLFAKEIRARTQDARIILTGRSANLTPERKAVLDSLSAEYRSMNLADAADVQRVIAECGALNGVIHAAGVIADNFILKKNAAEFRAVLEPKVTGTQHLDAALQSAELDFFVLCSAGAAVSGNAGQADYAAANGFMDQLAHRRRGRTVSINWPLWREGGMGVSAATREWMKSTAGLEPMRTDVGLEALHRILSMQQRQVQVAEGNLTQLRRALFAAQPLASEPQSAAPQAAAEGGNLQQKTQDFLKRQLAPVLKLAAQRIDAAAPFEKYGIDSILMMNLTQALEKTFGSLPKTLFFEYQTLAQLTQYFASSHSARLMELFGSATAPPQMQAAEPKTVAPVQRMSRERRRGGVSSQAAPAAEPIAIVGLSGRYPEAIDIEEYWRNLRDGKDCIVEVPKERWDWREYFTADRSEAGRHYSKWGGFIQGVDEFDPMFFNISPREAKIIDPQERLFLQHAWMAVEDAGYTRAGLQAPNKKGLAGQVGVYVGVMYGEYNLSGSLASIANRVSYVLNLHGPSMTLDTMCSSSLTAIHLACQDLKQGRTDLAIAGGVNVSISPSKYSLLSAGQFISSDGHCQSFGEGGDGYIPGEGVGVVVLKRLSDAEKAGDHIYAVIKGSALNHGGKTNGYTVPNPQAQASVITQALSELDTNPRHISYIEAHGTGTKLGDPIEIAALSKAFAESQDTGFCAIGSAKSNIGHCESAAGIAGLTKVVLQMQHRQIVPSLHSTRLNPNIDFARSPFVVNQTLKPWQRPVIEGREVPRIAGLSSFGAGGSNAHIIVEEYPAPAESRLSVDEPVAIPLSARTAEQLRQRAKDLLEHVRSAPSLDLPSMAYTLQVGREALDERLCVLVRSVEELKQKLQAFIAGEEDVEGFFHGQLKNHKDTLSLFTGDSDLQETLERWIARKNLPKLLGLWVKGLELDWSKLHGAQPPRRVSLPTYPFAREKYWTDSVVPRSAVPAATVLHPLLHTNTSDFSEQSYTSVFDRALSSICFLEMARAAVTRAARTQSESSILELRNVAWGQPLAAGQSVTIALFANGEDAIEFEIYSAGNIVHCQGEAIFSRQPAPARLDVSQLKMLPLQGESGGTDYLLHPRILEGALSACGIEASPLSLSSLRVVFGCVNEMLAWVRPASVGGFDIDLCDLQGNVCVQMSGLSLQQATVLAPAAAKPQGIALVSLQSPDEKGAALASAHGRPVIGLTELGAHLAIVPPLTAPSVEIETVEELEDEAAVEPSAMATDQLPQQLKVSLAEALYMQVSDIDSDKSFVDLGLDSIVGVEWVKVINKQYGLKISATKVYDYPNIKALADFVAQEIAKLPAAPVVVAPKKTREPAVRQAAVALTSHATLKRKARISRAAQPAQAPLPATRDKIAIVGMSGRYPQAKNLKQYWSNIASGKSSIVEIPASRWNANEYYAAGKINCKWLGMLDEVECFDPLFFQISPAEAESMDPQHRLFMQEAYRAFEDAGYANKTLSNRKCGVYLGIMSNEYSLLLSRSQNPALVDATGSSYAIGSARIAYYLNLKGPAIPIDTACSSSLVGIHLACQALLNHEIDMALAGGVTLYLTPDSYLGMCQAGMLSPDGLCKTFDNSADGFVPGEGVGAVVLKRLQDAEADGDSIYGVIIASGINQDGKTNGITAPSVNSQIELERDLYAKHQIDPESITYVETHGTGTKLGDPIELEALATVFSEKTPRKNFCALGSVKSNIGHTSGAAGVASVQKVLLSMRHKTLTPSLNVQQENALFDFKDSPFYISRETKEWASLPGTPRRAAVSAFGYSGTNAHVVIEEYTRPLAVIASRDEVAIVLSARAPERLRERAQDLLDFVLAEPATNLTELAYTLQVGREAFKERVGFVARSIQQVAEQLRAYLADGSVTSVQSDLQKTLDQWLNRQEVDWDKLYAGPVKPRRISLPTYPFAKERYWTSAPALTPTPAKRMHYFPRWTVSALDASQAITGPILLLDASDDLFALLKQSADVVRVKPGEAFEEIAPDSYTLDFSQEEHFLRLIARLDGRLPQHIVHGGEHGLFALFYLCKGLLASKHPAVRVVSVGSSPQRTALGGFFKTLTLENPRYLGKTLDLEASSDALILEELQDRNWRASTEVRYRQQRREIKSLVPFTPSSEGALPLKQNGVYLITGGLGGLGFIFARYLDEQYAARLVLLGRSSLSAEQEEKFQQLKSATYVQADASKLEDVEQAVREAKARFSRIDGVIHAAGVNRDAFILKKTPAEIDAVLAPKVQGAIHLDRATAGEDLDLFVMFSSVAGALGNAGQCDYAYANHFLDSFAEQRKGAGRTLSINWPYWQEGGMTLSRADVTPLPTSEGIRYFEEILRSDLKQALALYGAQALEESKPVTMPAPAKITDPETYLKRLIGEEIKLAPERIDAQERFDAFGIDSIVVSRLNARLERDWGELPKTLFYEYETIEELAKYLAREVKLESPEASQVEKPIAGDAIAIIGVHGYYPQSRDLDEYWDNLSKGRDLVSPVPGNRWNAEDFYCRWGAFLEDFDKFDAAFFNIPRAEAQAIDPQERLFLSSVWAAIEDAGYTRESLKRHHPKAKSADVGVFVGVTTHSTPSALPWSIANRVSYVFDFQGPSMPVDTACSSSLVALHLACESLKRQDCQVAVAGGVNLYLHPDKYRSFCQRRMLAEHGRTRSFGAGDDGFIPGEGVGSLVLKPLSRALEHGDHVYAVITASAFDHSGRSNGYAAPNPNSQASLISHTLSKAGLHPESIGYIEGHGTGTQLGDSLEITALTQAFRKQTARRQFCPVGSAKANLGHSESAAGIAGVTKVLLQMKHRQLAPSIHSEEANPNIDFEGSPFYLQHGLTSWEGPRRALINSFGAGGVNACVVLEEYEGATARQAATGPQLIVLSAKSEERLAEYVSRLIAHVHKAESIDLASLAYTLQVGREAMPERLAVVVNDAQDLIEKLSAGTQVLRGSLDPRRKPKKSTLQTRDLKQIAQAWIAGEEIDWDSLFTQARPARISLPTYPFAQESYWEQRVAAHKNAQLHPLVSYNSSTLKEVSFSSQLSGDAFYARDHKVNDQMIFPGSGFLEIACVSGAIAGARKVRRIKDVVWIQPLVFRNESQTIQISLKPADESAQYAITSYDEAHERVVHSEGVIHFEEGGASEETLPIEALKAQCPPPLDGAHYYGLFEKSGIQYGPAFRTMQALYVSPSFALSKLSIAEALKAEFDEFILHPSIIDGALQTVSGLIGNTESAVPYLPFAIDEVEISRATAQSCYVYVEQAGSEQQGSAEIKKFNIRISNEKGLVLVAFKNFCVRAFKFTPAGVTLRS